jgi:glycosyltransferase involved in cell wall biosynthesis
MEKTTIANIEIVGPASCPAFRIREMARILFLVHRIPYPPNKGDKIRSWHFLQHLLSKHEVDLAFFVDDESDLQHIDFLRNQCASVSYAYASPLRQKLAALRGFLKDQSLTENAYPSRKLRKTISDLIAKNQTDLIFAYSAAPMAWLPTQVNLPPAICDLVDVDSAKWQAYSETSGFPTNWVYGRENIKLAAFENKVAEECAQCLLVSDDEASLFKQQLEKAKQPTDHIHGVANGVDCTLFSPEIYPNIAPGQDIKLIFTGAMDYQPNVEAVLSHRPLIH